LDTPLYKNLSLTLYNSVSVYRLHSNMSLYTIPT